MFWHDIRIESAGNIKNGTGLTIERTEVYWSYYRGKDHVTMIRFMNKKQTFPAQDETVLPECLHFIGASLKELGIERKLSMRTLLIAEEILVRFIAHAAPEAKLTVKVRRLFGDAEVTINAAGTAEDMEEILVDTPKDLTEMEDEDAQRAIQAILLRSLGDNLKLSHKGGINRARILTGQADRSSLRSTVIALLLGIGFGMLMRLVFPQVLSDGLSTYLLTPVKTIFMNALKIIIAPVIFFSIVVCISQFKNVAELGRIGGKVMGLYLLTTLIAVVMSMGLSLLIKPGAAGFALTQTIEAGAVDIDTTVDTSLMHTIMNIVPSNFLQPFLQSDTLQVIFLAVICGVALGMIGEYSSVLKEFFEACNSLFLTITSMITRLIPLVVFCSMALMIAEMGGATIVPVLGMFGLHTLCIFCMLAVYGLMIFLLARLNPFRFYKKNRGAMLTSFSLMSSSAAMPTNMKTCTEQFGISPKICSFSIPLGATVNMDGTCISLTVSSLFLARAYGIDLTGGMLLSLAVTNILLSLGAPGVPGVGLICLSVALNSIGVPIEAIALVMGIYPIINMLNTMSNTTGDEAVSLVVGKMEDLVDTEVYDS